MEYQEIGNLSSSQRATINHIARDLSRYFENENPYFDPQRFFDHITDTENNLLEHKQQNNDKPHCVICGSTNYIIMDKSTIHEGDNCTQNIICESCGDITNYDPE